MKLSVNCPICGASSSTPWATENGWSAVKCTDCACVFVSPRPALSEISESTKTGLHTSENGAINTTGRFWSSKVRDFEVRLSALLTPEEMSTPSARWLDIGCGFGELLIAAQHLLPHDAIVEGIEPSQPKREFAREKGLTVSGTPIAALPSGSYDFISVMNVLSHLPDPRGFLSDVAHLLTPGGLLIVLTGNGADIERSGFPGSLYLPDHLVFVGENSLSRLLNESGFSVISRNALPHFFNEGYCVRTLKNVARLALRRPLVRHTKGPFRHLFFKARLAPDREKTPL